MASTTDIRKLFFFCFVLFGIIQNGLGSLLNEQEGDTRVTALHVISDIKFRFATTMVSSRMKNYVNDTRKAVFKVTMPNEAFITEFLLEIGGVIYPGEIKDKRIAREQFENAMSMGQTAGYVGTRERETNQFFVEVSMAAYDKVTFNLTYQELLTRKDGHYDHQIYVDAGRNVKDMSVIVSVLEFKDIELFEVYAFGNKIETNSIDIRIEDQDPSMTAIFKQSPNARRVQYIPSLDDRRKGLTGQFVVRYDVQRNQDNGDILVVGGYFIHYFAPAGLAPIPQNVIFILDISGSMFGDKIKQLKSAMHVILDDLNPDDAFNILTFNSGTSRWRENIVRNTVQNINDAKTFVDTLEADGGTNIYDALDEGLILAAMSSMNSKRCTSIFFLTDGEPTDGSITDKTEIMTRVMKMNQDRNKTPIFTLAFGYDADYKLMRKIALQNYGLARRVYEAGDAENQISGFYQEIRNVLVKDVNIVYHNSVEEGSLTRTKFPNYFAGTEKVVAGKIKNSGEDVPIVEIHYGTTTVNRQPALVLVLDTDFVMPSFEKLTGLEDLEEIMEKSWAYLRVKQLLEDSESSVDDTEKGRINRQILDLSERYGFVTPLTSLVVTKPPEVKEKEENEDEDIQYPREDNSKPYDVQESRLIDDTKTDSSARNGLHSDLYSDEFNTVWERPIKSNNDPSLLVNVAHLRQPLCLCFNSLGSFEHTSNGRLDLFKTKDGVIEIQAELENKDVLTLTAVFVKTENADLIIRSYSVIDTKSGKTSNWRNLTFGDVIITKEKSQLYIKVGNLEFSLERMVANKLRIIVNHTSWNVPKDTKPTGILGEMLSKIFGIEYWKENVSVRITYQDVYNNRGAKVELYSLQPELEGTVIRQCYMVKTNHLFFFQDFRGIPRNQIKQ
ncbi:hypothetical protein CHS0354_008949 [Potamilus streckersoni]|uniref:Inter-alpha-trypsin inhibitor heavy chain H3-like n=1 Tax=Potamilus streckersoni TaxID=2493646 RepID=A0AAE0THM2_9BIVA|nr:hypothetical protein CHS0354_008949 [Potamilus streckersoni]